MAAFRNLLLLSLVMGSTALTQRSGMKQMTNPIRRVVTMMQTLQKKITEEGERDEKLFEAYMCYCKSGTGDLEASIEASTEKIPQVTAALESAKAAVGGLTEELKAHKADRAAAEEALAKAQALREKEAAAFAKASSDMKTNLAAMGKAIAAIEKGSGSFLQTESANVLRKITISMDLSDSDRDMLTSFLTVGSGYAPQSGAIVGILKQMEETMAADLSDVTKAEEEAIANYTALVAAKEKEIAANSKAIEDKTARVGEKGTEIVNLSEDLDDTKTSLAEDTKFLADLKEGCGTKEEEYELVKKTRAEELLALADTIKILNDDDALDLFKKTLPSSSASLLQVAVSAKDMRKRALHELRSAKKGDRRLDLIMMSVKSKKVSFDKILGMIDDMVKILGNEQVADNDKKAYCEKELDKSEDELKATDQEIDDLTKALGDAKETIAKLTEEIKALSEGIVALDKSVAEATENRKKENAEYKQVMAQNTAAKELLKMAKNRLAKFYSPKSAASFAQVRMHVQEETEGAPPPPPEAVGAYMKKSEESSGVLTLIDMLEADLDKEMQEMEVEEKDAQKDYEVYIEDCADKRSLDAKSIEEKEATKADLEASIEKMKLETKNKVKESYSIATIIKDLHQECDWLLKNFDVRKEARAGEVDALKKAKAVLSGADYSFVQTSHVHHRM